MILEISDSQSALPLDGDRFRREVLAILAETGYEGSLSLAVVDDAQIRELHRRFLDVDEPTDVIAFPLAAGEAEIVVSAERAGAEAAERGVDPLAELLLYVVHGVLHLQGYDDHEREDAEEMHARSLSVLESLGHHNTIPPEERGGKPRS